MYIREKLWLGNVALWYENWSRKQYKLHNVLHVSRSFLFWKHSNDNNLRLSRIVMLSGLSSKFFKSSCHSYLLLMNVKRGNLIVFPLIFNTEINVMLNWMIKGSVVNCSNIISVVGSIFCTHSLHLDFLKDGRVKLTHKYFFVSGNCLLPIVIHNVFYSLMLQLAKRKHKHQNRTQLHVGMVVKV